MLVSGGGGPNVFSVETLLLQSVSFILTDCYRRQLRRARSRLVPGVVIVGRGALNFIYRCKYIISFLFLFGFY